MKELNERFTWRWLVMPLLLFVLTSTGYAKSRDYYQIQVYRSTERFRKKKSTIF